MFTKTLLLAILTLVMKEHIAGQARLDLAQSLSTAPWSHPLQNSCVFCTSPITWGSTYCLSRCPTLETPSELWLLFHFVFVQHQKGPVPKRALSPSKAAITPQEPRLPLCISVADVRSFLLAQKHICLLTLISRNFTSPGDGCGIQIKRCKSHKYHNTFENHLQDLCP